MWREGNKKSDLKQRECRYEEPWGGGVMLKICVDQIPPGLSLR